jgi:hypothetical protein
MNVSQNNLTTLAVASLNHSNGQLVGVSGNRPVAPAVQGQFTL